MKGICIVFAAILSTPAAGFALQADAPARDDRDSAIQQRRVTILRRVYELQDRRSGTQLAQYLADPDPGVREAAAVALGSVQDSTVLPRLSESLLDAESAVAQAAAFAVGQTARTMSRGRREEIELEMVSILSDSRAPVRMIEEIGKFGTEQGLTALLDRYWNSEGEEAGAMIMSIARFAIRGVVSGRGVEYLLAFADDDVEWEVAYALQRCGDSPGIRTSLPAILPLARSPDRFVRMNIAVLLGKLAGETTVVAPLSDLAGRDDSWIVRVAAYRAIGALRLPAGAEAGSVVRRGFTHSNEHVALAAFNAAGRLDLSGAGTARDKLLEELRRMALNGTNEFTWRVQAEAALALASADSAGAVQYIDTRERDEPRLQYALVGALGRAGSAESAATLEGHLKSSDPRLHRAALEALQELLPENSGMRDRIRGANLAALESSDMAVMTTAAQNLGDTLLLDAGSVKALLLTLGRLSAPADIEAIQAVCATLGKLKDQSAVGPLQTWLEAGDPAAAQAAAQALQEITGADYTRDLHQAEPLHLDFDFDYLEALSDSLVLTLETSQGNIRMRLNKSHAPFTVMNIVKLAENGFYRGLYFHRVVSTFVVQGGDPRGDGWGGPGYSIRSEFSPETYATGTVGIASAGKDTEGCQFFIAQTPQPHLDGRYTIIGRVISGIDVMNKLMVGDRILDLRVAR